jgi:hypothetical protein
MSKKLEAELSDVKIGYLITQKSYSILRKSENIYSVIAGAQPGDITPA